MSDIICQNCGQKLPDNSKFCNFCGGKAVTPSARVCPSCKSDIPDDMTFCVKCGQHLEMESLTKKVCPFCNHDVPEDMTFCVSCGKNLKVESAPKKVPPDIEFLKYSNPLMYRTLKANQQINPEQSVKSPQPIEKPKYASGSSGKGLAIAAIIFAFLGGFWGIILGIIGLTKVKYFEYEKTYKVAIFIGIIMAILLVYSLNI